jgi:hypothetical protein
VILYHANGEAFVLNPAIWRSALELAKSAGWQPRGTLPPPSDLERAPALWHGAYDPAAGQQVLRLDAMALSSALWRALAADRHLGHQLYLLAEFCQAGSFLICASPGITDSLASLVEHAGTVTVAAPAPAEAHPLPAPPAGTKEAPL